MIRQTFLILLCLFSLATFAQNQLETQLSQLEDRLDALDNEREKIYGEMEELQLQHVRSELDRIGFPTVNDGEQLVHHTAMSLCYNEPHEQPTWVMHAVLPAVEFGNVTRTNDFRIDEQVTTGSADKPDYWESGYDRGHLAPSADFRWSEKAVSESFYYSNMSPQKPEFNRESWSNLEAWVRRYVGDFREPVFVVTGGILT